MKNAPLEHSVFSDSHHIPNRLVSDITPQSCWGFGLEDIIAPRHWKKIQTHVQKIHHNQCIYCGAPGQEVLSKWTYEMPPTHPKHPPLGHQVLEGFVLACSNCRLVFNPGLARRQGSLPKLVEVFEKVNQWDIYTAKSYLVAISQRWRQHSQFEWVMDLGWLKENLGIEILKIQDAWHDANKLGFISKNFEEYGMVSTALCGIAWEFAAPKSPYHFEVQFEEL